MDSAAIVDREFAAIEDDEVVLKRDTEGALLKELRRRGKDPSEYEIVALPKPHWSFHL